MKKYMVVVGVAITAIGVADWYYYRTKPGVVQQTSAVSQSSEISLSPLSICRALDKAVEFLNITSEQLIPVNEEQRSFLTADYATYRQHMRKDLFGSDELKAYVARDAATLNKILRENGFSIQLQPFRTRESIGVVAIQNILVKWLERAERKAIRSGKKEYTGFHLNEHTMNVSFVGNDEHNPTIVVAQIPTQSNDKVYCAVKVKIGERTTAEPFFEGKSGPSDQEIMHMIDSLRKEFNSSQKYMRMHRYNAVELPMINYKETPSIEWLLKLLLTPAYKVAQALQEVIFKMNDTGAQAKAAVAIEINVTAPPYPSPQPPHKEPLIVNQPFLLWIERPGMPLPIFAAYLEQKYWEDPGAIEI